MARTIKKKPTEKRKTWGMLAPLKSEARHKLRSNCGDGCFLDPEREKYPICEKCNENTCSCKPTKQGVQAALNRARMQKNDKILKLAKKKLIQFENH